MTFVAVARGSVISLAANWIKSSSCSDTFRSRQQSNTSVANRSCALQLTTEWVSSRKMSDRRSLGSRTDRPPYGDYWPVIGRPGYDRCLRDFRSAERVLLPVPTEHNFVSTSSMRRKFTLKGGKNVRSWNRHIRRRRSFFQLSGRADAISSHVGYMVRCDQAVSGNVSPSHSARPRLWYGPIFDADRKATGSHCDRP